MGKHALCFNFRKAKWTWRESNRPNNAERINVPQVYHTPKPEGRASFCLNLGRMLICANLAGGATPQSLRSQLMRLVSKHELKGARERDAKVINACHGNSGGANPLECESILCLRDDIRLRWSDRF